MRLALRYVLALCACATRINGVSPPTRALASLGDTTLVHAFDRVERTGNAYVHKHSTLCWANYTQALNHNALACYVPVRLSRGPNLVPSRAEGMHFLEPPLGGHVSTVHRMLYDLLYVLQSRIIL